MKPADKDILEVLAELEEDMEGYELVNGADDEGIMPLRRMETLIRRLAREAGYELSN